MLPLSLSSLDRVDWVPVDRTANIILELARHFDDGTATTSTPVFHIVNPSICSWSSLVPAVASSLGPSVKVVPWDMWLAGLEETLHHDYQENHAQNPGVKLIDFYRGVGEAGEAGLELPVLETTNTRKSSPTLDSLEPVKGDWMKRWMEQWGF